MSVPPHVLHAFEQEAQDEAVRLSNSPHSQALSDIRDALIAVKCDAWLRACASHDFRVGLERESFEAGVTAQYTTQRSPEALHAATRQASAKAYLTTDPLWGKDSKKVTPRPGVSLIAIKSVGQWFDQHLHLNPDWSDGSEITWWVSECAKIARMIEGDFSLLGGTVEKMKSENLTIASPRSVIESLRAFIAGGGKPATSTSNMPKA